MKSLRKRLHKKSIETRDIFMQNWRKSIKYLYALCIRIPKKYYITFISIVILLLVPCRFYLQVFDSLAWTKENLSLFITEFNSYLKIKNTDSFISSTLTSLWTATIWALAIIFSISLFAVQQGYATYAQRAVNLFLRDPVSRIIYFITSVLIFCFYSLAFLDQAIIFKDNLWWLVILWAIGVCMLLVLIFIHYQRVTSIISPIYVIKHFWSLSQWRLKIKKTLFSLFQKDDNTWSEFTRNEKLRFNAINNNTNALKEDLEEICNVIKKYQQRKEYSIVQAWLDEIVGFTKYYIDYKKGLFFPWNSVLWMIPWASDMAHDNILEDLDGVLEKLKDIANIAIKDRDIEIIKRILHCYETIAVATLDIEYRWEHISENHHFTMALGYIQWIVKDGSMAMPDIAIQASYCMDRITPTVFSKDISSIYMNASHIALVADAIILMGIINTNARYTIKDGVRILLKITCYYALTERYDRTYLHLAIDNLKQSIVRYLRNVTPIWTDMDFAIWNVFWELETFSIPQLIRSFKLAIEQSKTTEIRSKYIKRLDDLNDKLWKFYMDLLEEAGKIESGVILKISSDLKAIIKIIIEANTIEWVTAGEKEKNIWRIRWYFSNYWRIYDYHTTISKEYLYLIEKDIFELWVVFLNLQDEEIMKTVVENLFSIAENFRIKEKKETNFGYTVPRILLSALKYAIFIKKPKFFIEYLTSNLEAWKLSMEAFQWGIFIREYWSIWDRTWWMIMDSEQYIDRQITRQDLENAFIPLSGLMKEKWIYPTES